MARNRRNSEVVGHRLWINCVGVSRKEPQQVHGPLWHSVPSYSVSASFVLPSPEDLNFISFVVESVPILNDS